MATKFLQRWAQIAPTASTGIITQVTRGVDKGANFIGVDSNDSDVVKFSKNGTVATVYDDQGLSAGLSATFGSTARVPMTYAIAVNGTTIHAGVVGIVNPLGVDLIITQFYLVVTTKSSAAGGLDIGFTSTSISTASDNLADGLAVGSGTVPYVYALADQAGANGLTRQYWTAGKWVTLSDDATGNTTGLVGTLYLNIFKV